MSLYESLFSGVTGLTAQSRALSTISENITNINTVGFKAQTTHFSTLVAAGNAGSTPGVGGVLHTTAKSIDTQGILQTTESPTDIAIAGSGFFVVNSDVVDGRATGDTMFTRAGHFAINNDSHLANAAGHFLMGWKLDKDGEFIDDVGNVIIPDPTSEGDLLPFDLGDVAFTSVGTDNISIQATFPAQMTIGDQFSASSRLFDDLGGDHSLDFGFTKADHIQMAGTLVETEGGAVPALITVAPVVTPAALDDVDESTSATKVGYTLERTDVNADGDVTWTVTVKPVNGSIAADSSGTFDLVFNSAGTLTDSDMREVEVEWGNNLKAKNSIFAFDPSEINFVTESATPAMASTLNPGGAVLKLDIATSNLDDDIIVGGDTFVRFNTSGDFIDPASLVLEVDYSNLDTFAPNTTVSIDLGTPNTQTGLSVNGSNFVLNSMSQDGQPLSDIKYVLSGPAGSATVVYDYGEERSLDDASFAIIRNLDIPIYKASPEQPKLSAPRPIRSEEGPEEHRQFSELTYMEPTDMTAGPGRVIGNDARQLLTADAFGGAVHGFGGDDQIHGGVGNDDLYGGNGDDTFYGLAGRDVIVGWLGEDTLDLHNSSAAIIGGNGAVRTEDGDRATLSGIEKIIGSTFSDRLHVDGQNKEVHGRGGNDMLTGGIDSDVLIGNSGHDTLRGGHGDDRLLGGTGNDFLNGHQGQDFVSGGAGDDRVYGHNGDDELLGGDGQDRIWGFNNDDRIRGGSGDDRLIGGGGEDDIDGGDGTDRINAGTGNDLLSGGGGIDILRGGDGADVFRMADAFSIDKILDFTPGFDQLQFASAGFEDEASLQFEDFGKFVRITSTDKAALGNTVILVGVSSEELSSDDFLF